MKIGLFGGSFNPPHVGHKHALETFAKKLGFDCVLVIPSFISPHKDSPLFSASFEDRLEMCRLAFGDIQKNIIFSDVERRLFDRTGEKSYTYLTVDALKKEFCGDFYLFVGSDMFFTLPSWKGVEKLIQSVTVCAMKRSTSDTEMESTKERYEKDFGTKVIILDATPIEISSTEIREKSDFTKVDGKVAEYIKDHKLYKEKKTRDEIVSLVKERLSEKRFIHTLGVEEESLFLASLLAPELSEEISRAALLHDVTKHLTIEEHLKLKPDLSENDLKSPDTIHALTAAVFAEKVLFESAAVSSMIERHTTANEKMTLGEMIVFVADYTEKNRSHLPCVTERQRLHRELTSSVNREERYEILQNSSLRILENTVAYLTEKNSFIHPKTFDALKFLKEQVHKEKNER